MAESNLVKVIKNYVEDKGGFAIKFHGGLLTNSGVPDLIGGFKGRPFAVECKVGNNKPSKLQLYYIGEFSKHNYVAGVVYSLEEFKELFND